MLSGTIETIEAIGTVLTNLIDGTGSILVVCVVVGMGLLVGNWILNAVRKLTNSVKK